MHNWSQLASSRKFESRCILSQSRTVYTTLCPAVLGRREIRRSIPAMQFHAGLSWKQTLLAFVISRSYEWIIHKHQEGVVKRHSLLHRTKRAPEFLKCLHQAFIPPSTRPRLLGNFSVVRHENSAKKVCCVAAQTPSEQLWGGSQVHTFTVSPWWWESILQHDSSHAWWHAPVVPVHRRQEQGTQTRHNSSAAAT